MPQPGKYGRLPSDPGRPRLTLEKYLDPRTPLSAAGLPKVSLYQDVDRLSRVRSWPMYANDQIGDCTVAGLGHMFGAWSTYSGEAAEALFTDDEIIRAYSRVSGYVPGDPGTDNGAMMSDVLADARVAGLIDTSGRPHKALGYAAMGNPADEVLLGQLLDVFGSVYVGFNVQRHIEDQFAAGQVWTYRPGEPYIGGHAVCLQRREIAGSRHGILDYITWGAMTHADFGWQAHVVEEAWVVVSQDWLQANGTTVEGLDLTALLADMQYV
jgi:hypothetical protein